jgi:hypothetical protein
MRIQDKNFDGCYVELKPTSNGYDVCELRAGADISHGNFAACSDSVPMLHLRDFIEQFEGFIESRDATPKLEGVYDSYFLFYARGDRVLMEFSVGDATVQEQVFNLKGVLEIDTNVLSSILADFKELASESR